MGNTPSQVWRPPSQIQTFKFKLKPSQTTKPNLRVCVNIRKMALGSNDLSTPSLTSIENTMLTHWYISGQIHNADTPVQIGPDYVIEKDVVKVGEDFNLNLYSTTSAVGLHRSSLCGNNLSSSPTSTTGHPLSSSPNTPTTLLCQTCVVCTRFVDVGHIACIPHLA